MAQSALMASVLTPEEKLKQQYFYDLLKQGTTAQPIRHWTQGLAQVLSAGMGGYGLHQVAEEDRASKEASNKLLVDFLRGGDTSGTPSPSAGPTVANTAATYGDVPAAIRNNNPGAQWPGPSATRFGATGFQPVAGNNKIATFPDPESGGAAQFDLLNRNYTGMRLADAIKKWSGGNNADAYVGNVSKATGLMPETLITADLLRSPQGIALARAMARHETGRDFPMTPEQWAQAQAKAFGAPVPAAGAVSAPAGVDPAQVPVGTTQEPPAPAGAPVVPPSPRPAAPAMPATPAAASPAPGAYPPPSRGAVNLGPGQRQQLIAMLGNKYTAPMASAIVQSMITKGMTDRDPEYTPFGDRLLEKKSGRVIDPPSSKDWVMEKTPEGAYYSRNVKTNEIRWSPVGTNVSLSTDKKGSEMMATKAIEGFDISQKAMIDANKRVAGYGQMLKAMEGFTPGATAEFKLQAGRILKDLNIIKDEGVSDAEKFKAIGRRLELAATPKGQGQITENERVLIREQLPTLTTSPEGIVKVITMLDRLDRYDVEVAKIYRANAEKNGGLPNYLEVTNEIAKLGPPLTEDEQLALSELRAGNAKPAPAPNFDVPGALTGAGKSDAFKAAVEEAKRRGWNIPGLTQ